MISMNRLACGDRLTEPLRRESLGMGTLFGVSPITTNCAILGVALFQTARTPQHRNHPGPDT